MICDDCGASKTGFSTLFCPNCEADTTLDDSCFYFVGLEKIEGEPVLHAGTAIFKSFDSATRAVASLKSSKTLGLQHPIYVYSTLKRLLRLDVLYPFVESLPTGGEECEVVKMDLIGVTVNLEGIV